MAEPKLLAVAAQIGQSEGSIMKRIILAAVVAAAVSAPLGSYAAGVHHPYRVTSPVTAHQWPVTPPPPRARWMKVSCRTEDQVNCAWNAQAQGHHHSFYVVHRRLENKRGVRMGQVTCVFYVKAADHKWDACHVTHFRAT